MKILLFLALLILSLNAQGNFGTFIDKQINLTKIINSKDATREIILKTTKEQEKLYSKMFENVLLNKAEYLDRKSKYTSEIYALGKIIKINKKSANKYAVLRDEVLLKSYKILDYQDKMFKEILLALDKYEYKEFQIKLGDIFEKHKIQVNKFNNEDYNKYLGFTDKSKVIKNLQKNIQNFYLILELTSDTLKYISLFDKKIYTINKYSQFKLLKPILYIDDLAVVKLIIIIFLILLVYLIRKVVYKTLEKYIVGIKSLEKYSKNILDSIRKLVETLIIFINIELVLYVYNDFVPFALVDMAFNIVYSILFTFIIYAIVNSIASIKVSKIQINSDSIKYEIINIVIKIINFLIWIVGILLVLYFAGVNLTAVLSGLGIGGFAIALAAKDSLANFFGTLSILFSDMFSQGDWIDVNGKEGTVIEIGLRVTTLRTFDNAMISIPNAVIANNDVKNWNRRSLGRRIKMKLGVKYDSNPTMLRKTIEDIYKMLDKHPSIATKNTAFNHNEKQGTRIVRSKDDEKGVKKTLLVYLDEFDASSINILIYCFSKTVMWQEWLAVKQDVMFEMMDIMQKNNIEFAFPSLSVYHENELK
jgi:MscS family membrane protein